ncbi:MAG: carboxypeptidase regulatory-like domain-containing protein, partial [Acidobacteria bacterium]|nr:carboxypeptidase regulatory-like domain-containing protein [Acidobacteriota bacterium]
MQRAALAVLATAGLLCSPLVGTADAQVLYGSIVGNVTDAQGAQVPAASVTITNNATNFSAETVTNSEGGYSVPNVLPGSYDVKVSLQGFREFVKTGVPVSAGQISRVDVKLDIGAMTEVVTVESAVQLLQTDKTDLHTELKSKELSSLPLNQYRNYQALMNLVPGATPTRFQNAQTDTPGRALTTNVNGTNRNNNVTRIDGAASINVWLPHHAGYIAPVETIETVNISTNSFDASQGMTGGAAITVATKSGTNDFRGSTFWFANRDEFNARQNFFSGADNPNSSVDILGGTLGGPIRRNGLFFFGGWERNLEKNSRISTLTVPTALMRTGNFSEVLGFNSNFRIYDPATGNPATGADRATFAGAQIPASRMSPIASAVQAQYPLPNVPGTNNGTQNNYERTEFPEATRDNYDFKVNWNRTAGNQIWAKYSRMDATV